MDIKINRFFITGEGNIKYTYNNGLIASDPQLASMNFLNALEQLPALIKQEEKKVNQLQTDLPILSDMVKSIWQKEKLLSDYKTDLASIERKIQLSITRNVSDQNTSEIFNKNQDINFAKSKNYKFS